MNVVASLEIFESNNNTQVAKKYVLTYGFGSKDFEDAISKNDFAVYYDDHKMNEDVIAASGHKVNNRDLAARMFGAFDLEPENFRA